MSTSAISKNKKNGTPHTFATPNGPSILSLHKNASNTASSVQMEPTDPDLPRISWLDMDLKDLHSYRHAYRLDTPTSQINPHAHLFLAHAARKGIYSPSVVAARRKQWQLKKSRKEATEGAKERSTSRLKGGTNVAANLSSVDMEETGKQTKDQLATAVRKHFNAMSVSEAEVVARFTYVVRHNAASMTEADEDKGFRMRFKP